MVVDGMDQHVDLGPNIERREQRAIERVANESRAKWKISIFEMTEKGH
jgi:hypothetical protein